MLFNKSIRQRNLQIKLEEDIDLEILRLFLKKIKLNINKIEIDRYSNVNTITGEDFELMKP
jgi:hypothetical protein